MMGAPETVSGPVTALRHAMDDADIPGDLRAPLIGFFCNHWNNGLAPNSQWAEAYAAFIGAFDTPLARRQIDNEFAQDARRRLRDINDLVTSMSSREEAADVRPADALLVYRLVPTTRRLTFDILWQGAGVTYMGDDDGPYFSFTASNGYQVISRSRMDIQTERIWLLGAKHMEEARSGSMVFSTNEKRDAAMKQFIKALDEWAAANGGTAVLIPQ
jgi:hypothetical protein